MIKEERILPPGDDEEFGRGNLLINSKVAAV
jgi:hypothetical protein